MIAAAEIRIDKEFAALCPPLTPEERSLLELSLATEGCKHPLIVWRGLLVDGHNRFDFCKSEGMEFDTEELEVSSREEVIEWIIKNQLGRRNCTEEQKSYLRGKRYTNEKSGRGGDRKSKGNDCTLNPTADKLGDEYGVSPRTIKNDAAFATAVDTLAKNVGSEVKAEILSGASPLSKKQIVAIAELPAKQQAKAVKEQASTTPAREPKSSTLEWDVEACFSALRQEVWRWVNAKPKPAKSEIVEIQNDITSELERGK